MERLADPHEDGRRHWRPQAERVSAIAEISDDKLGRLVAEGGALTEDEMDELGHLVWRSWWSSRTGKAAATAIGHAAAAEAVASSGGERRANDDRTAVGGTERAGCVATHGAGTAGESWRARQEGRGEAFGPVAKKLRDAATRSLAESYLDHARANGGKCKRGFAEGLVDQARSSAPGLGITWDDIMNEVKRMQKGRTDSRAALVSPAETNNAAPPTSSLDLLASAVLQISPVIPWEVEGKARAEAEQAHLWAWRAAQSVQRAAARTDEERQAKNARERARYKARRAAQSKEEWEAENARKRTRRAALLEG